MKTFVVEFTKPCSFVFFSALLTETYSMKLAQWDIDLTAKPAYLIQNHLIIITTMSTIGVTAIFDIILQITYSTGPQNAHAFYSPSSRTLNSYPPITQKKHN